MSPNRLCLTTNYRLTRVLIRCSVDRHHKVSIIFGFINKIHPVYIGAMYNLQILSRSDNCAKQDRLHMDPEKLINLVNSDEFYLRLLKKYDFDLQSEWAGQKYYLYISQTYGDVRFVGAPPVTVAAFGNDADNWGSPQHKCDFAMYRIYTAPDGSPAEYSPDNVPMKTTYLSHNESSISQIA